MFQQFHSLDLITLITLLVDYKLRSCLLRNYFHPQVASSPLGPNIPLSLPTSQCVLVIFLFKHAEQVCILSYIWRGLHSSRSAEESRDATKSVFYKTLTLNLNDNNIFLLRDREIPGSYLGSKTKYPIQISRWFPPSSQWNSQPSPSNRSRLLPF
jgi:hypothetical protein